MNCEEAGIVIGAAFAGQKLVVGGANLAGKQGAENDVKKAERNR